MDAAGAVDASLSPGIHLMEVASQKNRLGGALVEMVRMIRMARIILLLMVMMVLGWRG